MGNTSSDPSMLVIKGNAEELRAALDEDENLIQHLKSEEGIATVHLAAILGHLDIVFLLLERGVDINCRVSSGETLLFSAVRRHHGLLAVNLIFKGIDMNIKNSDNETVLHVAANCGHIHLVKMLLRLGIEIHDDINTFAPQENEDEQHEDGTITYVEDSRPTIFAEMENRRKRAIFVDFVDNYIEYQPYIDNIYTQCFFTTSENVKVIPPSVGWGRAEDIRNKYYLDEVFFYLHLHIANLYTNTQPDGIITTSSTNSMNHGANNSDKTSTLMTILTDKLRLMLKPDQNLAIEVPYVQRDTDESDDDDDEDNNDEDNNDNEEVDDVDNEEVDDAEG